MAKKKNKKIKKNSKPKENARAKMIGQHIGYRYDVNLLPDYKKITPFLKKYVEHMGWDDLNWLEDVHMGYEEGSDLLFLIEMQMAGLLFQKKLNYQTINNQEI